MKINRMVLLMALLMSGISIFAQDANENSKWRISEVKKAEGRYVYADRTSETPEKALNQAVDMLIGKVTDFLKKNGEKTDNVADMVKDKMTSLALQRGNKFRAFVFVEKKQISAKWQDDIPVVEIEEKEEDDKGYSEETQLSATSDKSEILQKISGMTTRIQVYDYISQLQNEGKRVAFVVHPNAQELPTMYMLLYKRNGTISAILSPVDANGQRHNLATGIVDIQANYPATSVNGFVINEK